MTSVAIRIFLDPLHTEAITRVVSTYFLEPFFWISQTSSNLTCAQVIFLFTRDGTKPTKNWIFTSKETYTGCQYTKRKHNRTHQLPSRKLTYSFQRHFWVDYFSTSRLMAYAIYPERIQWVFSVKIPVSRPIHPTSDGEFTIDDPLLWGSHPLESFWGGWQRDRLESHESKADFLCNDSALKSQRDSMSVGWLVSYKWQPFRSNILRKKNTTKHLKTTIWINLTKLRAKFLQISAEVPLKNGGFG